MTLPTHHLHVYMKPALGNGFLSRHQVYNYQHSISAMGWYDTASCNVALNTTAAEIAFESWIGNRVAIYVDNPVMPIWEGLITRVTPEFGNVVPTRSLDAMFNRVKGLSASATAVTQQTAASNDTDSQAIYGIKEGSQEQWFDSPAAAGRRTQALIDFMIAWQAFPQSSLAFNPAGKIVRLEMQGMYHTLDWENVRDTGVTLIAQNTLVSTIIGAIGNGTTFFDNADTSQIDANAITANEQTIRGETVWQQIMKWTESGDGTNRYIAGITPTDPNTGTRVAYYRQANTAIEYTANARDGARIRNQFGGIVNAWNVVPDRSLRVNDILIGWNSIGDDPREIYIESVNYDAESQQVALASADDITTDGVIQAKRFSKMLGSRFGPPVRVTSQ